MTCSKHTTHLMSHKKTPTICGSAQVAALETEDDSDQTLEGSCTCDVYLYEFQRKCNVMKYSKQSYTLISRIKSSTICNAEQVAALEINDASSYTLEG